jgi:hypothetical protein
MDADMRQADDQMRLYREGAISSAYVAQDLGAPHIAAAIREHARTCCPFGPLPPACNDNGESGR